MEHINADISEYEPREHRSDLSGVISGFVLLLVVFAGLFVI